MAWLLGSVEKTYPNCETNQTMVMALQPKLLFSKKIDTLPVGFSKTFNFFFKEVSDTPNRNSVQYHVHSNLLTLHIF